MISQIIVEKNIRKHSQTERLLKFFNCDNLIEVESVAPYLKHARLPYHHRYEKRKVFIGENKTTTLKEAPPQYGNDKGKHYYFIHAYNCIYDCSYCYLQGHLKTPHLFFYVNHDQILNDIENLIKKENGPIWFHAGEFSDSLALSHITQEWEPYFKLFNKYPNAFLELRTKSSQLKSLENLSPSKNIYLTYSLMPEKMAKLVDKKAAPIKSRLMAIKHFFEKGYLLGIHFDPIIIYEEFKDDYYQLFKEIVPFKENIALISLGDLRFTHKVYSSFSKQIPKNSFLHNGLIKEENLYRYEKNTRESIFIDFTNLLTSLGLQKEIIYKCMN